MVGPTAAIVLANYASNQISCRRCFEVDYFRRRIFLFIQMDLWKGKILGYCLRTKEGILKLWPRVNLQGAYCFLTYFKSEPGDEHIVLPRRARQNGQLWKM